MAKRSLTSMWLRSVRRGVDAATRSGIKAGVRAAQQVARGALKAAAPAVARHSGLKSKPADGPPTAAGGDWVAGIAMAAAGARRYQLFRPPAAAGPGRAAERLPLLVMLHGCTQDAAGFAHSTRMNRLAVRERFVVLYPEQDRRAHPNGCWNWYATRTGQAHGEAAILAAAVDQVCRLYPVDRERVALVGLSAGASMAALMAVRQPGRYRALVMHSGLAPGSAQSVASALAVMQGQLPPNRGALAAALSSAAVSAPVPAPVAGPLRRSPPLPSSAGAAAALPPLLVIQGAADRTVVPSNGRAAAEAWAEALGARAGAARQSRRGQRHPSHVTDFRRAGRTLVSLCEVEQLGHAWSGGDARLPFGDAAGPDASRMAWAFAARQFGRG